MRQVVFVAMLICFAATVKGQNNPTATQPCKLTVAQSPEIRGVRLGMTVAKLQAAFPEQRNQAGIENAIKASKVPASYGVGRVGLQASETAPSPKFENVDYITVDLLDDRVSGLHISYIGPEWRTPERFISKLSEAFHLPPAENWSGTATDPNRSLKCEGFVIVAYASGNSSSVSVSDLAAPQTVNNRREADKEKVRQAFKPW